METQAAEAQDTGSFQDIVEHAKTQSEPADKPAGKANGKSDYSPPVDFSALPDDMREAVEGRITHLSRLMKKQSSKYESQLKDWQGIAAEQSRKLEELTSNMDKVVDHVQGGAFKTAEDKLNSRLMEAHANGDVAGFIKANAELTELNVKKVAWEKDQAKPKKEIQAQPKQSAQEEPRYYSADEALEVAVDSGEMSRPEANAFKSWMDERDDSNRPVRPWAYTQDVKHPSREYQDAMKELRSVFDSPRFENLDLAQKLAEVDRRMGVTRTASGQQVMGGNLTTARKSNKVALTTEQETVAKRFKFAGPGKSDAEHLEAYRKQLNGLPKKGDRK